VTNRKWIYLLAGFQIFCGKVTAGQKRICTRYGSESRTFSDVSQNASIKSVTYLADRHPTAYQPNYGLQFCRADEENCVVIWLNLTNKNFDSLFPVRLTGG
jgi:hypothetical protein